MTDTHSARAAHPGNTARRKDTGEPGNGGQFGTTRRVGSGLTLTGKPRTDRAAIENAYGDLLGHTQGCRESAVGCSVENIRDARIQPETREWALRADPLTDAVQNLADGTAACRCDGNVTMSETSLRGRVALAAAVPAYVQIPVEDFDSYVHAGGLPGPSYARVLDTILDTGTDLDGDDQYAAAIVALTDRFEQVTSDRGLTRFDENFTTGPLRSFQAATQAGTDPDAALVSSADELSASRNLSDPGSQVGHTATRLVAHWRSLRKQHT